jgi:hypothetical protein
MSSVRTALFTKIVFCILTASTMVQAGCMDTENEFWLTTQAQKDLFNKLVGIMSCPVDADASTAVNVDAVSCNYFVGKALVTVYGVKDFAPEMNGGRWLTANEIIDSVRVRTDVWTKLGDGNDQNVLRNAAAGAATQPVIATMKGAQHGHVALVLPGELKSSSTWVKPDGAAMVVPNSAAFTLNDVNKAYIFCRLSRAFAEPDKVELYWRVR